MVEMLSKRMFGMLDKFYPDLCAIQESVEEQDSTGHPEPVWSDLAGHRGLPCRISPLGGTERKTNTQVYSTATHVIELTEAYPSIITKMRVVAQGRTFDILLVERDGQEASSRLVTQVVV